MSHAPGYLLDSDVLITAKNRYYTFRICPGFWSSMLHYHTENQVHSIDRVRQELLLGRDDDDLVQWVRDKVPSIFFITSNDPNIVAAFTEVMRWATRHPQYHDEAKAKFASGADGWLVAHSMVSGRILVTNEQPRPESRTAIKLPDVCQQFGVSFQDTFAMLHALEVSYVFTHPN